MQGQKVGAEEKLSFSALAASLEVAISLCKSDSYSGASLSDYSPAATDAPGLHKPDLLPFVSPSPWKWD